MPYMYLVVESNTKTPLSTFENEEAANNYVKSSVVGPVEIVPVPFGVTSRIALYEAFQQALTIVQRLYEFEETSEELRMATRYLEAVREPLSDLAHQFEEEKGTPLVVDVYLNEQGKTLTDRNIIGTIKVGEKNA